jgi:predicted acetyltransferase
MAVTLRWIEQSELDRVAQTRMQCYSPAAKDLEFHKENLRADKRPAEFLLAELDGQAVGTATSQDMSMWVRGAKISTQGVAWVGTIKTHRRGGRGIASQLMRETLCKAREREFIVSALMPFRASFYQHFGYGIAERRCEWHVPMSILPQGDCDGVRFMKQDDLASMQACRQRMDERGQCAIERTPQSWQRTVPQWSEGFCVVDRDGSWMFMQQTKARGKTHVRVEDAAWDSHDAFLRQLHFLANLRDQYSMAVLSLPADFPLNHLLREPQLPHRVVEHAAAQMTQMTRMQMRILDHARFLQALKLPPEVSGKAVVAIRECEGNVATIAIDCDSGHMAVKSHSGPADVECSDVIWAAIASGDLRASTASHLGLIRSTQPAALKLLDAMAIGPLPFCREYF